MSIFDITFITKLKSFQITIVFFSIFLCMCNPKKSEDNSSFLLFFLFSGTSNAPTISSFTPTSGPVGTRVVITGLGFGTSIATNTIQFNGTTADITAANE